MLDAERVRRLLTYDPISGSFTRRTGTHKGKVAGGFNGCGYVQILVDGVRESGHRLAFLCMTGRIPSAVDHIDGDRSNNSWANLRPATNKQNQENWTQKRETASGIRGVTFHPGNHKWCARLNHNGRRLHIGYFETVELATEARKRAERAFFTHSPL